MPARWSLFLTGLSGLLATSVSPPECFAAAPAASPATVSVHGGGAKRQLTGSPGRDYVEIVAGQPLTVETAGPAVLVLEAVAHQGSAAAGPTLLGLSLDGKPWTEVSLPCHATAARFSGTEGPQACAPMTRRLDILPRAHRIGIELRGGPGASVYAAVESGAAGAGGAGDAVPALEPIIHAPGATDDGAAQPGDQVSTTASAPSTGDRLWQRFAGNPAVWVPAAGAVLAAGVGIALGVASKASFDDHRDARLSATERASAYDRGTAQAWAANVLFGTAALAAGGAAFMFFITPEPGAEATAAAQTSIDHTTTERGITCGVTATFQF